MACNHNFTPALKDIALNTPVVRVCSGCKTQLRTIINGSPKGYVPPPRTRRVKPRVKR